MTGKIVRIRDRNQVTLPPEFLNAASVRAGDFLEISVTIEGHLTLVPKRLVTWKTPEAEVADREAETDIAQNRYRSFASASAFARDLRGTRQSLTESGPARSSKKKGPETLSGRLKRSKRHKAVKQRLKPRQRSPAIETS